MAMDRIRDWVESRIDWFDLSAEERFEARCRYHASELNATGYSTIQYPEMVRRIECMWREEYECGVINSLWGVRLVDNTTNTYEAYRIQ
jgi:hypothetical protein